MQYVNIAPSMPFATLCARFGLAVVYKIQMAKNAGGENLGKIASKVVTKSEYFTLFGRRNKLALLRSHMNATLCRLSPISTWSVLSSAQAIRFSPNPISNTLLSN